MEPEAIFQKPRLTSDRLLESWPPIQGPTLQSLRVGGFNLGFPMGLSLSLNSGNRTFFEKEELFGYRYCN
jgi:hypothetical protein